MFDPSKLASERRVYLAGWLNQAQSVQDAVPKVQQQLDIAKWEEESLSNIPNQAANIVPSDLTSFLAEDLETVHQALPEISQINTVALDASCASTSTTSAIIFQVTDRAQHSNDPQVCEWGTKYAKRYETLQEQFGREQQVRGLLHNLKPNLALEFDNAVSEYRATLAGTGRLPNAGIALRNVIEHYKGEIMNLVRQHAKKQKITWEQMSNQLVDDIDVLRQRFQQQEDKWNDLQQRLSKLAKGLIPLDESELKRLFTEFIDHLYIVLSLINMGKKVLNT